jgi:hypothetical protein
MRTILILLCFVSAVCLQAQNTEELYIEPEIDTSGRTGGPEGSKPGDIILIVKSDIEDLHFESNLFNFGDITYDKARHEYMFYAAQDKFPTKRRNFKLAISSPRHIAKDVHIDGAENMYIFKISSKMPTGKLLIHTNPKNAYVKFGKEGISSQITDYPFDLKAGEYHLQITKANYLPIDTTIIIPTTGEQKDLYINLVPDFAMIRLDIVSADMSSFKSYPIISIGEKLISMADLEDESTLKSLDNAEKVEFFEVYKGGFVPVPQGNYNVAVSANGFKTYNTILRASKNNTTPLTVRLEPFTGYLTIADDGGALGAKVFAGEQEIGTVPFFRQKIKEGTYNLRFEKEGFLPTKREYIINITRDMEENTSIQMTVYREYYIQSNPSGAEIQVNGEGFGFTPGLISLNEGKHHVILKKTGYFEHKRTFDIKTSGNLCDTVSCELALNYPIRIKAEESGLNILVTKGNDTLSYGNTTPAELMLPYGVYKLKLLEGNKKRFSGSFRHDGATQVNAPVYSMGTFTALAGDYFLSSPEALTKEKGKKDENLYNLLATAQIGRFNLFPGLSTSLVHVSFFDLNKKYKNKLIDAQKDGLNLNVDDAKYQSTMFAFSAIFLNGEFRMGGSVLKELDICALGKYVWYPNLTSFMPMSHIDGSQMFFGIEISSRISCFNVNLKLGQEIYNGNYNFLVNEDEQTMTSPTGSSADKFYKKPFELSNFVCKIGFTLGEKRSKGNNMLRLWSKPFISGY